jgi:hypothetical protein
LDARSECVEYSFTTFPKIFRRFLAVVVFGPEVVCTVGFIQSRLQSQDIADRISEFRYSDKQFSRGEGTHPAVINAPYDASHGPLAGPQGAEAVFGSIWLVSGNAMRCMWILERLGSHLASSLDRGLSPARGPRRGAVLHSDSRAEGSKRAALSVSWGGRGQAVVDRLGNVPLPQLIGQGLSTTTHQAPDTEDASLCSSTATASESVSTSCLRGSLPVRSLLVAAETAYNHFAVLRTILKSARGPEPTSTRCVTPCP